MIKKGNKERIIFAVILVIFILIYHSLWINKTYTMTEGWAAFFDELMIRGKVPYKDFYYQMPPINLLLNHIILKFCFGYTLLYRLWRLIERIVIFLLGYSILAKRIKPSIACYTGMITCVLQAANVHDLCGDYNQSNQLIIMIVALLLLKYYENIEDKKRYRYAFLIGICGGIMFLMKQPLVLAAVLAYLILFLLLVAFKIETKPIKVFFLIIIGACVPIIIAASWCLKNNCLQQCIDQVFMDVSAKGSLYMIVVGKLLETFDEYKLFVAASVFGFFAHNIRINNDLNDRNCGKKKYIYVLLIILSGLMLIYAFGLIVNAAILLYMDTAMLFVVIIQIALIIGSWVSRKPDICICTAICLTFLILYLNIGEMTETFAIEGALNTKVAHTLSMAFLWIIVWINYHVVTARRQIDVPALIIAFSALTSGYSLVMTNGEVGVTTICAFLVVPAVVYLVYRNIELSTDYFSRETIIHTILLIVFGICLAQKLTCAYSWWGDEEESYWVKTEKSNIKTLKGFKFSKEELIKYEKLNEIISDNTDESSVIWGFPYTKVYNLFQDNYNMNGFVPVEFYDTCSDQYAEKEAQLLSENPPDIVIWQDIPGCIETHERVYRDGTELGQRKIVNWFVTVRESDYELIGQVDDVFVYKLKSSGNVKSTYIQSKHARNDTATKLLKLKGLGCKSIPYQIESEEDLTYLRDYVNEGHDCSKMYFEQTCDISLEEDWIPIGNAESTGFAGIYDGAGYKISNMYMLSTTDEDLALFGILEGKVVNLTLEDSWVGGRNVALIANSGDGDVINCFSSGILYGYSCSGITYCTNGIIENNVSIINVDKGIGNGISGIKNEGINYSSYNDGTVYDSGNPIDASTITELNKYVDTYNKENNDIVLLHWEMNKSCLRLKRSE